MMFTVWEKEFYSKSVTERLSGRVKAVYVHFIVLYHMNRLAIINLMPV